MTDRSITVVARVSVRVPADDPNPAWAAEHLVRGVLRRVGEVVAFHVETVAGTERESDGA